MNLIMQNENIEIYLKQDYSDKLSYLTPIIMADIFKDAKSDKDISDAYTVWSRINAENDFNNLNKEQVKEIFDFISFERKEELVLKYMYEYIACSVLSEEKSLNIDASPVIHAMDMLLKDFYEYAKAIIYLDLYDLYISDFDILANNYVIRFL